MKIGQLNMNCGECAIIEFCSMPFCYAICSDDRFLNVDDTHYERIARQCTTNTTFVNCQKCKQDDCYTCEFEEESKDFYSKSIAKFVYEQL